MSLIGPRGKQSLLRRAGLNPDQRDGSGGQGDKATSSLPPIPVEGERDSLAAANGGGSADQRHDVPKDTSPQGDEVPKGQGDMGTSTPGGKRTDYEKKGYYVGLRHQDILDDLARDLRRLGLPDDRSMIVRALIDAAGTRRIADGNSWVKELADYCKQTLPGTSKQGTRG